MYRLNTAPPTLYTVRGLFTRPVKNPPIGCNKLVYERFEPGRQLWYASTIPPFLQPLCPNSAPQSGSICSPVVDRRGNVVENALHRGKDDKSWFRGIDMPCRASRKRCWKRERPRSMDPRFTGDNFERRMQSRVQTILSGSIHFRDVPSAWLYLSIIDWFRNEKPLSLCVSIHAIDEGTVMFLNEWWKFGDVVFLWYVSHLELL